jgi:transposase-like protein
MKPKSRELWSERVARWAESGLDAATFANKEGINAHTLKNWRWKLRTSAAQRDNGAPSGFVELVATHAPEPRVVQPAEPIEVHLRSGVCVLVPSRFDAESLRRLVAALEAR